MIMMILVASMMSLLVGCNLDFINGTTEDNPDNGCPTTTETEDIDGDGKIDRKTATDCNDILLWGEAYQYDSSGNRIGTRRYRPRGGEISWNSAPLSEIVSTTLFDWDNGGKRTLLAYYRPGDTSHDLQYYTRSAYNGDHLVLQANYEPGADADALQWYEVYEFAGDLEIYAGQFSGDGSGRWLYSYEYDAGDRPELTTAYTAAAAPSGSTITAATGAISALAVSDTPWAFDVGLPEPLAAFPDAPDLSSDPAEFDLELLWTQRYWYTPSGSIFMRYDPDLKPLLMNLEDSSLDEEIQIAISYNDSDLPARKVTSYGNTEVLRLEFAYTDDSLIRRIATSGAGLLIPLEYEIDYSDDNVPSRISVHRDDTLLQYFEYEYTGENIDIPTSVDDFDPIGFGGRVATITQFDGDRTEIGRYEFSYDIGPTGNVRIDALEHDAESEAESYTPNGHFLIEKDGDGNTVSFSSYAAPEEGEDEGERIWYYAYNYDDLGNRIAETRYDENDLPSVPSSFDWELLFE